MKRFILRVSTLAVIFCLICSLGANAFASSIDENGVWLDFSSATDEELEEAIIRIKAEQRARLKTKVNLDYTEIIIAKGKNAKVTAEVVDVPEDLKAGKITWTSSDPKVASCQQGTIKGVANGEAIVTALCVLSDGTEVYNECFVTVYTPISGLSAKTKSFNLGVGESVTTEINIQPKDASNINLSYSSSDSSVATVTDDGIITGVGVGKATITASATDGSEKTLTFTVTATKKDDRGKTKTDSKGTSVTFNGIKQTKGSSYAPPDPGNIFVLIDLEIANNSSEEVNISSIMSFTAYCDGYTCDYSFSATLNTSRQMDGSIAPGKKMKGQIGLEVPTNWKEIELHVTPDYWGGSDVEFVIYNH